MYKTMNGRLYRSLIDYGIRNLSLHCEEVNELNIFPVPDGDTGTNMVTTLRNGYAAIEDVHDADEELSVLAKRFASAVVYGARGNSGVILSQFCKGFSKALSGGETADTACFADALSCGVELAYRAVSHPTEGTMLTVLREATETVREVQERDGYGDLSALIGDFLARARVSLENTPNLLPVLKQAGVVDSGGIGVICFFEGMYKYLNHETLSAVKAGGSAPAVDYDRFDCDSTFEYGYCTELLLQLLHSKRDFDEAHFSERLNALGESLVISVEGDKVKVHVHTDTPEAVLSYCHSFGEFLTLKIENMTVQHSELHREEAVEEASLMVSKTPRDGAFAVVTVAIGRKLAGLFLEMGADAVIVANAGASPSTQDFLEAFEATGCDKILVFPNNKNLLLAAEQAKKLSKNTEVAIVGTQSVADCYAALAMLDFGAETLADARAGVLETIENVYAVRITRAVKDAVYGEIRIEKDDVIAMSGSEVLSAGKSLFEVARAVTETVMGECERDTVTLFPSAQIPESETEELLAYLNGRYIYTETDCVGTGVDSYDLILSFE